jgi:phosphatidylglycerol---prolipoprotein diacylglyceryl transferase
VIRMLRRRGRAISRYKVMLFVGCVAGIFAGTVVAGERGLDESRFALAATALLLPAFVGARSWFVARHWDEYRGNLRRVVRRSEGGMALFGGLALAPVVSIPVLAAARLPYWRFWDAACITMLVGLMFTRLGCLMNGCCAGRPTNGPLGMWLRDSFGFRARRWPTQLLEASWAAVVLVGALATRNRMPFDGARFVAVVVLYCTARAVFETTRADSHTPAFAQRLVAPAKT